MLRHHGCYVSGRHRQKFAQRVKSAVWSDFVLNKMRCAQAPRPSTSTQPEYFKPKSSTLGIWGRTKSRFESFSANGAKCSLEYLERRLGEPLTGNEYLRMRQSGFIHFDLRTSYFLRKGGLLPSTEAELPNAQGKIPGYDRKQLA